MPDILNPFTVYEFIKEHFFEISSGILAIVGFALRFRGYRKQSTVIILIVYFIIYILPAIL
jgi:hypothetical protein